MNAGRRGALPVDNAQLIEEIGNFMAMRICARAIFPFRLARYRNVSALFTALSPETVHKPK
jgi:hypothetical protein